MHLGDVMVTLATPAEVQKGSAADGAEAGLPAQAGIWQAVLLADLHLPGGCGLRRDAENGKRQASPHPHKYLRHIGLQHLMDKRNQL